MFGGFAHKDKTWRKRFKVGILRTIFHKPKKDPKQLNNKKRSSRKKSKVAKKSKKNNRRNK